MLIRRHRLASACDAVPQLDEFGTYSLVCPVCIRVSALVAVVVTWKGVQREWTLVPSACLPLALDATADA